MTPRTPLEKWPDPVYHGRPGYSARHFRAVSPPSDNPLTVARRIVDERASNLGIQARGAAFLAGDNSAETRKRIDHEDLQRRLLALKRVNERFEDVIAALESAADTPFGKSPVGKSFLRQARAAKRAHDSFRASGHYYPPVRFE